MRTYPICDDPDVVRAAAAVLEGIVSNGIDPDNMEKWRQAAQASNPAIVTEIVDEYSGLGEGVIGIGWQHPDGEIFLLAPERRDSEENSGWSHPAEIVLTGGVPTDFAVTVLGNLARHLGVDPS